MTKQYIVVINRYISRTIFFFFRRLLLFSYFLLFFFPGMIYQMFFFKLRLVTFVHIVVSFL